MMNDSSSDVWVLLAVLYGGWAGGKTLRGVIGAADYINHAIPPYAALAGGLARLLAAGLVVEQAGRYRPTAKIAARYDDLAARHRCLWKVWDELTIFLLDCRPKTSPPPPAISRPAYEESVREYVRRFWS